MKMYISNLVQFVHSHDELFRAGYPLIDKGHVVIYERKNRATLEAFNINSLEIHLPNDQKPFNCLRCRKHIWVDNTKGVINENCLYHIERPHKSTGKRPCCLDILRSYGCRVGETHVYNGLRYGINYIPNIYKVTQPNIGHFQMYAIDCEMCYTQNGMEVCKISVVDTSGYLVYESFVYPESKVIDYNTRYSGITEENLYNSNTKTLRQVQEDLLTFIGSYTILVGHGLENDLRALKLIHTSIIDTAILFRERGKNGVEYKRSLKSLSKRFLGEEIQVSTRGHCSSEDALAAMKLLFYLIMKQQRFNIPEIKYTPFWFQNCYTEHISI